MVKHFSYEVKGIVYNERFDLLKQIALGTVTNIEEAVKWLSYTYLYVRMRCNPLAYGINYNAVEVSHKRFSIIVLEAN